MVFEIGVKRYYNFVGLECFRVNLESCYFYTQILVNTFFYFIYFLS